MNGSAQDRVEILLEALPYIREFHGRTVVIKYGGAAMTDEALRDAFATDVVLLKYVGLKPVIVHGGGPEITRYMERLGMEVRFVEGVRVSDPETVEVAKMVLLGKVNADIVMRLNRHGQPAVGLSGEDGALFSVAPHAMAEEVGFVGEIERVDVDVLNHIAADYIPVIASMGTDRDGQLLQRQRRHRRGQGRRGALGPQGAVPDRRQRLAGRPGRPGLADLAGHRRRGLRRGGGGRRRHAPQARSLPGGDPRRGAGRAHHRRAPPARFAAGAVHRRRRRHDGHPVSPPMSVGELQALEARYAMPTYARAPVEFVRGDGWRLWDSDGEEYLDFFAGLSVHNAGHCHPAIVAAVAEQAARFAGSSNLYYSEPAMRLCERLAESSLGGKVFLANTGTEASECAIKLVRKHAHGRGIGAPEIVVLSNAFHGRTLAALAATPKLARDDLFGPLPRGFVSVPREDPEALRAAVGPNTAAVMIEPIQGEAGIFPIDDEVLAEARDRCDATGALLVFDEVQTGVGRTGTLWAYEQLEVRPDVLTSAKALGGGLPVGAVVTTPELGDVLERGDHGSTFAGGPITASAALATLDLIDDPELLVRVRNLGERFRDGLAADERIVDVRGRGLMVGVTLAEGVDAAEVATAALDRRLVLNVPGEGMLRFLPPLIVGTEQVDEALARLTAALDAV